LEYRFCGYILNAQSDELRSESSEGPLLRGQAVQVLAHLVSRPNVLHSTGDLATRFWGDLQTAEASLRTEIGKIREALGKHKRVLATLRRTAGRDGDQDVGVYYAFVPPREYNENQEELRQGYFSTLLHVRVKQLVRQLKKPVREVVENCLNPILKSHASAHGAHHDIDYVHLVVADGESKRSQEIYPVDFKEDIHETWKDFRKAAAQEFGKRDPRQPFLTLFDDLESHWFDDRLVLVLNRESRPSTAGEVRSCDLFGPTVHLYGIGTRDGDQALCEQFDTADGRSYWRIRDNAERILESMHIAPPLAWTTHFGVSIAGPKTRLPSGKTLDLYLQDDFKKRVAAALVRRMAMFSVHLMLERELEQRCLFYSVMRGPQQRRTGFVLYSPTPFQAQSIGEVVAGFQQFLARCASGHFENARTSKGTTKQKLDEQRAARRRPRSASLDKS